MPVHLENAAGLQIRPQNLVLFTHGGWSLTTNSSSRLRPALGPPDQWLACYSVETREMELLTALVIKFWYLLLWKSFFFYAWDFPLVYQILRLELFPGWLSGKEFTCNAGDIRFDRWVRKSPGEVNGHPLQYSCLENTTDREAWQATVLGVAKQSDTSEQLKNNRLMSCTPLEIPLNLSWSTSWQRITSIKCLLSAPQHFQDPSS